MTTGAQRVAGVVLRLADHGRLSDEDRWALTDLIGSTDASDTPVVPDDADSTEGNQS